MSITFVDPAALFGDVGRRWWRRGRRLGGCSQAVPVGETGSDDRSVTPFVVVASAGATGGRRGRVGVAELVRSDAADPARLRALPVRA